jgi:hypothetical protein
MKKILIIVFFMININNYMNAFAIYVKKLDNISECMCVELEEIEKKIGKLCSENHLIFYKQYHYAIRKKFNLKKDVDFIETIENESTLNKSLIEQGVIQDPIISVARGERSKNEIIDIAKRVEAARLFCQQRDQVQ